MQHPATKAPMTNRPHTQQAYCAAPTDFMSFSAQAAGDASLEDAYNACVHELVSFRSQHRSMAGQYIAQQSRRALKDEKGTGGTDFMPALTTYRDTTRRHLLV